MSARKIKISITDLTTDYAHLSQVLDVTYIQNSNEVGNLSHIAFSHDIIFVKWNK